MDEVTELLKIRHSGSDQRSALLSIQQLPNNRYLQKNLVSKYFTVCVSVIFYFFFKFFGLAGSMFVFNNSWWIFLP